MNSMSKLGIKLPGALLEFINGDLFVVCLGMVIFILAYVATRLARSKHPLQVFLAADDLRLAASLAVFALGDAVIRAPVWYYRHLMNHGDMADAVDLSDAFSVIVTCGAVLCVISGLCAIRLMVSYRWGEWPWLLVAAAAALFTFAMI